MLRFVGIILLFFACYSKVQAQSAFPDQPTILYDHQQYGGGSISTIGWGGFYSYGKYKDATTLRLFEAGIHFIKHEKEFKRFSSDPNARGYVYGKQNSFFVLRASAGTKKTITEKLRKNGVQLSYSYTGGPSFGFTKPVYLEIFYLPENGPYYIQVEKFNPEEHFIDNIYGRAGGLRGFNELKFYPGLNAKFSLLVEYSNIRDGLKGIEVGGQVDIFAREIPIMAEKILQVQEQSARNHQIFPSLFINFFFGRKFD